MSKLFVAFIILVSFQVGAESVLILEKKFSNSEYKTPVYQVNPELGRAWFRITEIEEKFDLSDPDGGYTNVIRAKVPGMVFNRVTEEITVTKNGQEYICANTEVRRRVFGTTRYIYPTGVCKFSQEIVTELVDDGYYIKEVKKIKIYLVLN